MYLKVLRLCSERRSPLGIRSDYYLGTLGLLKPEDLLFYMWTVDHTGKPSAGLYANVDILNHFQHSLQVFRNTLKVLLKHCTGEQD